MGGVYLPWLLLFGFFVAIGLEMFLPSAGILFLASICLAVSAIVFAFLQSFWTGVIMSLIVFGSIPFLIATFAYVWPKTPLGKKFIISAPEESEVMPEASSKQPLQELIGQRGEVTVEMLPTGEFKIGKKRYSGTCQSGSVEKGVEVQVTEVKMGRLYVLPASMIEETTSKSGFEQNLEKTVENTSFEDFSWDEE